jgi:hypothetical protein
MYTTIDMQESIALIGPRKVNPATPEMAEARYDPAAAKEKYVIAFRKYIVVK